MHNESFGGTAGRGDGDADSITFPPGFFFGAATSAHQTEGNNVASDHWQQETADEPPARVEVPSGDACDSYHRYGEDIGLVADSGLTHYRFSIEWARIEPAEGLVLRGQLDHYRRMVEECLHRGVTPVVTLNHATVPAWLGRRGSWDADEAPALFERYVRTLLPVLEGVQWVCTINEPNMSAIHDGGLEPDYPGGLPPCKEPYATHLVEAHQRARDVLKTARPDLRVGWTVGCQGFRVPGRASEAAIGYCHSREWRYLEAARDDDFVGVQNYSFVEMGDQGPLPPRDGTRQNMLGWQIDPVTLADCVRRAHELSGVPVLVTEHGLATRDDTQRISYTAASLRHLRSVLDDRVPVLGYLHWSLLDNYEWGSWTPTFGLVEVDRESFERRPKPSLAWLGEVSRTHRVPSADADRFDSRDTSRPASALTPPFEGPRP